MASVNFQKCKGGASTKAIIRHCDKEKRKITSHSNESIDISKTDKNITFPLRFKRPDGTSYEKVLGYEETCARYDKKIKALDENGNTNKRKDRVTCFALCVPAPEGLKEEDFEEFFFQVNEILKHKYGYQNLINSYVHVDEVHGYKDAETGLERTSRAHGHFFYIPEREGQLNGKWFSSRSNMNDVNKQIDLMSKKLFGIRFMDGSQKKSRKSVEKLKNESLAQEINAAREELAALKVEIQPLSEELDRKKVELTTIENQLFDFELNGNYQLLKENKALKEENKELKKQNDSLLIFINELFQKRDFGKTVKDLFNMRFGKKVKREKDDLLR